MSTDSWERFRVLYAWLFMLASVTMRCEPLLRQDIGGVCRGLGRDRCAEFPAASSIRPYERYHRGLRQTRSPHRGFAPGACAASQLAYLLWRRAHNNHRYAVARATTSPVKPTRLAGSPQSLLCAAPSIGVAWEVPLGRRANAVLAASIPSVAHPIRALAGDPRGLPTHWLRGDLEAFLVCSLY
jgi:hypothetical protein